MTFRLDAYRQHVLAEQARREDARAVRPFEEPAVQPPLSETSGATQHRSGKREMELVPFERFGPVRLDATEKEVVAAMGEPDRALSANASRNLYYAGTAIRVEFDTQGRCHLVHVTLDAVVPIVDGDVRLVGTFGNVVHALHARGFQTPPGPGHQPGLTCHAVCDALGLLVVWIEDSTEVDVVAYRLDVYRKLVTVRGT